MSERVDPQTLQSWLEWAAVRLIAMPAGRLYPDQPRALWPDYVRDEFPGAADLQTNRIRALAPSSAEISIVDIIILLPNLCEREPVRKVVHWRCQLHPIRQTRLITWNWIADKLHVHKYTAQRWHRNGLVEISEKIPYETVCRISAFLEDRD
jgi:hypothetical protein